ncbi:MAG: hypothetical protein M3Y91_07975 [Actinomycetota bacterium]|nr:hypothetical protein [Actinomycetota bacterium]
MVGVQGPVDSVSTRGSTSELTESAAGSSPVGWWLTLAGIGTVVLSAFGGVFPYFANGLGLPLDGAANGAMTAWRTVLHLVPGVAGILVGLGMIAWGRRRMAGAPFAPAGGRCIGRASLVVGAWFAIGPYLYGIVAPSQAHGTGGHAGMVMANGMTTLENVIMPVFGKMTTVPTTANCALTMGICHWAVGGLIVFAGLVALGAGTGVGPLASLFKAGTAEDLSWPGA